MQTAKTMHITNSLMPTATSQVNGTARSRVDNLSESKPWCSSNMRSNCFGREYRDENKASFSEKLKVLLENGGIAEKIDDPYAFQEVEQCAGISKPGSNHFGTIRKCSSGRTSVLGSSLNSEPKVVAKATESPTPTVRGVTAMSVPVYMTTNQMTTFSPRFNLQQSDILPRHPAEAAKVKSPLLKPQNVTHITSAPRAFNSLNAKPTITKPVNTSNVRTSGSGKPFNFGKSQMSKLAIAKIEKTLENRNKNVSKATSSNSIQKTAAISKFLPKLKRPVPARSASLDSDVTKIKSIATCKSLLEESLLGNSGMKSTDTEKTWVSLPRSLGTLVPVPETASTTVYIPTHSKLKHESLQRIWALRNKAKLLKRNYQQFGLLLGDTEEEPQDADSEIFLFQKYWFSLCNDYDSFTGHRRKREVRLAQLKTELRHKLKQQQWRHKDDYRDKMAEFLIGTARRLPNLAAFLVRLDNSPQRIRNKADRLSSVPGSECRFTESGMPVCGLLTVPGAPFCMNHITRHSSQLLFTPCTSAGDSDCPPCGAPAFVKSTGLGLCAEHQREQNLLQKPKQVVTEKYSGKSNLQGKRNRSSLGSSRSGRTRKRKRQLTKEKKDSRDVVDGMREPTCSISHRFEEKSNAFSSNSFIVSKSDVDETQDVEVGEEGLVIASAELPLDSVELATLATQATRLLEEHDFTNVLNHIPADAFNDLFTEDKEEYEPTPQETEELERALEAVDNDVKSLEKLTQTQGLLDMLDEQSIAQTLAALPEVVPVMYQNGFAGIGTIGPLEQSLCDSLPNPLLISSHTDILQS